MVKKLKIKFNDFCCPNCFAELRMKGIYGMLQDQYEKIDDENGYMSILTNRCTCGHKYKIYCECHEIKNTVTVCIKKIIEVQMF